MDFSFKDFSWGSFSFEYYGILSIALLSALFLLFEYFPGRNYFYSLQSLRKFIDKHLIRHLIKGSETRGKSWLRSAVVSIVWLLLVLALANPRWDYEQVEGFKPNINIVILLDVSRSMDAQDEKPSRLERAKQEIMDIINKGQVVNIGLIAFANQAYIVSPVTDDKNAIQYLLPSVNTDLVGVQGSNIAAGLRSADLLLKPMEGGINYIIVMSDGGFENTAELQSLGKSVRNGKMITFGFGGEEGAPIPDASGKFIKDGDKTVMTKLEKQNLILLSGLDNYIQSTYLDNDTDQILSVLSRQFDVVKNRTKMLKIWHDRFYIPLILAVMIILPFFRRGVIFPVMILLLSTGSFAENEKKVIEMQHVAKKSRFENLRSAMFKNQDQQAGDLYEERQYMKAEEKFTTNYNKGVAAYRNGDYQKAEQYFSIDAANDINAEYNKGNAELMQMKLKECAETLGSVLKKSPDHQDAKANLEICRKLKDNPKNKDKSNEQDKQQQQDKDNKQNQQDQKDKQQQGKPREGEDDAEEKPQESDGNEQKKELDIQAKSILSKISSDPSKLMKSRFRYEEGEGHRSGGDNVGPKPW